MSQPVSRKTAAMTAAHGFGWVMLLLVALALFDVRAHAAPAPGRSAPPTVVLLSLARCCPQSAWPGAERRLADELKTLGVRVVWVWKTPNATGAPSEVLTRLAAEGNALAAVRILRPPRTAVTQGVPGKAVTGKVVSGQGVIIAWHERLTGKTSIRRGRVARLDRRTEALVALRAVELLRASLLEMRSGAHARSPKPPPPTATRLPPKLLGPLPKVRSKRVSPPRWSLRLAGSLVHAPGGLPVRAGLLVALRWWAHPLISMELQADITPFGRDLEELDRRTSVQLFGAAVTLLWEIQGHAAWRAKRCWRIQPALGLGAGARLLRIQGWDSFDLEGQLQEQVVADLAAVAQIALRIAGPVRLRASLRGGVLLPPVGVRYPTGRVATIGAAYIAANVGVEVTW